jgi:hypothetical protein
MRGEALLKALSFYNKAWDSDTQSMSRKQAKSVYLENYRLSLNIAVQMESLEHWLKQNVNLAQGIGFLARFLVNIPESRIGERRYVPAPNDVLPLSRFINICEERLAKKACLEEPKKLHFSQEASSDWIKYFNELRPARNLEALGKSTQRLGVSLLNKQQGSLACSRFLKILTQSLYPPLQ